VAVSGDVTVHHKDQVIVFRQVQTSPTSVCWHCHWD